MQRTLMMLNLYGYECLKYPQLQAKNAILMFLSYFIAHVLGYQGWDEILIITHPKHFYL